MENKQNAQLSARLKVMEHRWKLVKLARAGGFVLVLARAPVGHRRQPDVALFKTLANTLKAHQFGVLLGILVQDPCQIVVAIKGIKSNLRHDLSLFAIYSDAIVFTSDSLCNVVFPGPGATTISDFDCIRLRALLAGRSV